MWISFAYRSYTDHIKLMLRLKNKEKERSLILLMNVSNQKVKREPLEIRVGFDSITIGSEDTTFCQSHASTAFFFRLISASVL